MFKKQKYILHMGLFALGGALYIIIELLWRRRTHISMFGVGGLCFLLMGQIHTRFERRPLPVRCGLCSLAVTAVEFISGCVLNRWLGLGVWDYSDRRCHLLGQVCLLYALFWLVLAAAAWPIYRLCRRLLTRLLCRRTETA